MFLIFLGVFFIVIALINTIIAFYNEEYSGMLGWICAIIWAVNATFLK